MSKHDLQARPVYHHKRESVEAHLTIVFAPLVTFAAPTVSPEAPYESTLGSDKPGV